MTKAYRRTMLRLGLFFGVCAGGVIFACSSSKSNDPTGPSPTMDGGPGGDEGGRSADGAPLDAGAPDANYRDPRAADGACNPPNRLCGDGGDAGFGGCTAVSVDRDNCGACDRACLGASAVCIAGQCDCNGAGFAYCAGTGCMDVTSDLNNCGICGNVCDPAQFTACVNSVCM